MMRKRAQTPARVSQTKAALARLRARRRTAGLCVRCSRPSSNYRCDTCRRGHRLEGRGRLERERHDLPGEWAAVAEAVFQLRKHFRRGAPRIEDQVESR